MQPLSHNNRPILNSGIQYFKLGDIQVLILRKPVEGTDMTLNSSKSYARTEEWTLVKFYQGLSTHGLTA